MKRSFVTTSWDDGHVDDLRLADMLKKYGVTGTFYVSPEDHAIPPEQRLTAEQIRQLARNFEIGAHTMTHPHLPKISDAEAEQEMGDSKTHLEKIIRKPVTTFCYPGGDYTPAHARIARKLGFIYARTTKRHSSAFDHDFFQAETTVHTFTHYQDLWKIAKFARFNPYRAWRYLAWDELAIAKFDEVMAQGGVFHLWGHSWIELNRNDVGLTTLQRILLRLHRLLEPGGSTDGWARLERVLKHISGHKNVEYITNGQLPALKPKNILMVAPYFPPHTGGQEYYAYNLARQLQRGHDWNVTVVTTQTKVSGPVDEKGLRVYRLKPWFKLSNTPINPLWERRIRQIIEREDITVINTHAPVPFMAEVAMAAAGHIPVVLTYHMVSMKKNDWHYDWLIDLYENGILPRRLREAAAVTTATDEIRLKFLPGVIGEGNELPRSITVSGGVDTDRFKPAGHHGKHPLILFNGSYDKASRHKGLGVLIDAMPDIIKAVPDVQLKAVGRDEGRADYEAQAKRLGVSKHVRLVGRVYDNSLVRLFQDAWVFCLPSLNDSYPMVIPEAMASGLPVVATDVGGVAGAVGDGGYIVPAGDPKALADKLVYVLTHKAGATKLGKNGRAKAVREMSWHEKAVELNQLLLEVQGNVPQQGNKR